MEKKISEFNNQGKYALVTGAGGLLGIQHCKALLEIDTSVILTDINNEILDNASKVLLDEGFDKNKILCFEMDVTKEESIKNVARKLEDKKIRIDILINNAAINPSASSLSGAVRTTRLENFSLDRWNLEVSVGLTGAFLCSKVFGTAMASDGEGGVILNIASDLSVIAPDQNLYRQDGLADDIQAVKPVTYSVIKTGIVGLTRYLSSYWPDKGVRANALSPGGVYVDQDEEFVTRLKNRIPMGRMADQDEYVGAIQFLCSDASKYMNGQNIVIDGGRSVI